MKRVCLAAAVSSLASSLLVILVMKGSGGNDSVQSGSQIDRYSLLVTTTDLPKGFQQIFLHDHEKQHETLQFCYGEMTRRDELRAWRRRSKTKCPSEETIAKVLSRKTLEVSIKICPDPNLAKAEFLRGRTMSAVAMNSGSWSGRQIGELCFVSPGALGAQRARSFVLAGLYGSVYFYVNYLGESSEEYASCEKLALSLCERIHSASALGQAPASNILIEGKELMARKTAGADLISLSDFASVTGAGQETNFITGDVWIRNKDHSLRLKIGQKMATLDGKRVTLVFPVLRWGRDQVFCPVEILRAMSAAKPSKRGKSVRIGP